jgi:protein SCO1
MPARKLPNLRWHPASASRRTRWAVAVAAVLLAAAAAAAWLSVRPAQQPRFVEVTRGIYTLPKPDVLADFQLVKHDGTGFGSSALKGRWSFVIFGYTFCPDFCPTTLVVFNEMHALLAQRVGGVRDVQFVMFSVDPERDTPKLLGNYVPQFNPEFVGVTGDAAEIKRLAESVGAVYAKVPGSSDSNYLVDHSTAVLLVNPQGRLQGVFAMPHVAKDMVQGFLKIREHAGAAPTAEWRAGPKPLSVALR